MTDDKKLAAEDLARTIGENKRLLERHGVPLEVHGLDEIDKMAVSDGDRPLVHLIIGMRGEMTRAEARRSATAFRKIVEKHPNACVALAIAGYDRDPRAIDEIPEAAAHYVRFARFAGVDTLAAAIASPLHRDSIGVLGATGALKDFDADDIVRIGSTFEGETLMAMIHMAADADDRGCLHGVRVEGDRKMPFKLFRPSDGGPWVILSADNKVLATAPANGGWPLREIAEALKAQAES